jgi:hypothetical protein
MAHLSESNKQLHISQTIVIEQSTLLEKTKDFSDVCMLVLPPCLPNEFGHHLEGIGPLVANIAANLTPEATLITIGEIADLVHIQAQLIKQMRYQFWISIKRTEPQPIEGDSALPHYHFGALVHTQYKEPLHHIKTRVEYTYCPACDKTTKDYGGKKQSYDQYGTLISDVWRDIG